MNALSIHQFKSTIIKLNNFTKKKKMLLNNSKKLYFDSAIFRYCYIVVNVEIIF